MSLTKVKAGNTLLTTPSASSNDVTIATTQYVTTAIGNLVDTAPSTLNTLNELAAALGDDANFSTTVTNNIATKLPLAGGTMTGAINISGTSSLSTEFKIGNLTWNQNSSSTSGLLHQYRGSDGYSELQINNTSSSGAIALNIRNDSASVVTIANNGNATFAGGITAGAAGISTQDHRVPTGTGYITYSPANQTADVLNIRRYGTVQQKFDQYGVHFPSGNVGISQTSFGTNGKLQVTGGIGLTGTSVIRNSTNADDGSTLKFLGNQFVAGQNNSHSYSYSGGGLIASVSPSAGAILMDVGANSTSGHRLKVINGSNGADGSLQYLSGTTSRFHVDSASGDFLIGTTTSNAYRLEVYDGDYTTMMVRGPTYPTIRLKADNQNGGNNGAISIGASNALVLQPNNTTQGIAIENNGRLRSSTKQYYLSSTSGRGDHYVHTGGHHGAGTYTLFTMPANVTQSAGMVEIWWIYGTPSAAGYTKYLITGNKGITTLETSGLNGTGAIPTIAWSGQDLRVTNSNGSTYYHVRVTLHEIGNIWNPTWGNLSGIA